MKKSRDRVKSEEKPTIAKTKRKRNPPELRNDTFEKHQTLLRLHIQESI